jgi:hypothetical protein
MVAKQLCFEVTLMICLFFANVSPSSSQSEKFASYIQLLTIVLIGLRKPYTTTEVGAGIEMYNVYCESVQ